MGETPRQLSVGQEAFWFLYQLAPESPAYNVMAAVRIHTPLDLPRLRRALAATVRRHDLLRSVFVERDGAPCRLVGAPDTIELLVRDAPGASGYRLPALVRELGLAPFRLSEGTFRAVLIRCGPADAVLLLAAHHIATDATSQWLLMHDLLDAYAAGAPGEAGPGGAGPGGAGPEPWPPLVRDYDDYVAAERELLAGPRGAELERYWLDVCTGARAAELPTDRPRPAHPSFAGATCELRLPDELLPRLRCAAAVAGVTPFAYLLGSFQALLYHYTRQPESLIGCPTATRFGRNLRPLVGYLVNTLVLRGSFSRATTFATAVQAAQRQVLGGLSHAGYQHALLARALGLPRAGAGSALLRIVFTMVATDRLDPLLHLLADGAERGTGVEYAGLRLALFDVPQLEGQFDLSVEMRQSPNSLTAVFRYSTELFDRATVERLLEHYARFLDAAIDNPAGRVTAVPLVDDAALAELLALGQGAPRSGRQTAPI
ncbi:MAG TPA: condensation domain-containing protein [Mycobacteriales bacterium]|nr:condensation domain-containing protein [Mycobacteriales bacterium]